MAMITWPFPVSSRTEKKIVDCPTCYGMGSALCTNCSSTASDQASSGLPPGKTYERADGTACIHDYEHTLLGNCWHRYSCKFCPAFVQVDSGD